MVGVRSRHFPARRVRRAGGPDDGWDNEDALAVVIESDIESDAIVQDLVGLSPIVEGDLGDYCVMCGKVRTADIDLMVPESHESHCVWRRAREACVERRGPSNGG
jgi:hypothetical protein